MSRGSTGAGWSRTSHRAGFKTPAESAATGRKAPFSGFHRTVGWTEVASGRSAGPHQPGRSLGVGQPQRRVDPPPEALLGAAKRLDDVLPVLAVDSDAEGLRDVEPCFYREVEHPPGAFVERADVGAECAADRRGDGFCLPVRQFDGHYDHPFRV